MNIYKIIFYFTQHDTVEHYLESELELNDFTDWLNTTIQNKSQNFVNFIGEDEKIMVNMDKVVVYTIEQVENNNK